MFYHFFINWPDYCYCIDKLYFMGMSIIGIVAILVIVYFLYKSVKPKKKTNYTANKTDNKGGNYSKWIGGGLGWAFGGPLGAVIGFALGSFFGNSNSNRNISDYIGGSTQQQDFNVSLLVLSAAVMKADGTLKRSELDYVKQFFLRNFGQQHAERYILMLREILKQDFNITDISRQIGHYMDYSSRLQLLHYLFGIAAADSSVHESEVNVINVISASMGISNVDFESIKAMFVQNVDNAYTILGVSPSASDDEVKNAYREMAKKYHPDKVSYLGDDVRKAAEQKFKEVNDAYEKIKKQRGIF